MWKLKLPANISFFLWQFGHGALPTRSVLKHRGVNVDETCPRCGVVTETIEHCLFLCDSIQVVWHAFIANLVPPSAISEYLTWLFDAVKQHGIIIAIIMWKLWCSRNKLAFEQVVERNSGIIVQIGAFAHAVSEAFLSNNGGRVRQEVAVRWNRPESSFVSLQVDGSVSSSPVTAGFGGLVRDQAGSFLVGFYGCAGDSSILHMELTAIAKGLEICWEKGYRRVLCASDCLLAVSLIGDANVKFHRFGSIIARIRKMLGWCWEVQLTHIFREGNACADFLAKRGASCANLLAIIDSAPLELHPLLEADAAGIVFLRS